MWPVLEMFDCAEDMVDVGDYSLWYGLFCYSLVIWDESKRVTVVADALDGAQAVVGDYRINFAVNQVAEVIDTFECHHITGGDGRVHTITMNVTPTVAVVVWCEVHQIIKPISLIICH